MFQSNAWAVHLNRDNFSEHDVANALKRFFRTLNEPLLTERLRPLFLQAAAIGKKQHALIIQDQLTFLLLAGFFNNYLLILLSLHESHLHTLLKCNLENY